jgi:hypothetical protein
MNPWQYIKDLSKASKPSWEAGEHMHTALSSIGTLLVAALAAAGITKGHIDLDFVGWIVGIYFLVTFIFIAPYRLLDADRKTIGELREKIADKANRARIASLLAAQMMKGRDLMSQCTNPERRGPIRDENVNAWLAETQTVVRKELGHVYFALHETPNGTGPVDQFEDRALNITWNGLRYRVTNLRNMIEEFNKP